MAEVNPNDKYTKNLKEDPLSGDFQGGGQPGKPLAPDELPENPPQFSKQQAARSEQDVHPTSELSSTPKHGPGKPSSGKHPTTELHIKPKGRR